VNKKPRGKNKKQQKVPAEKEEETEKYELNFFLLQEAARMDMTRNLDTLTKAIVECNGSVIGAANQDNYMHLVAHLRNPEMLKDHSIHNVPYTNTFLDFVRWGNNLSKVTRYAWDQAVSEQHRPTIQSFLRFQLNSVKRGNNTQSHTKVAAWEDNKSIIQDLLEKVISSISKMEVLLVELREFHVYLSFALWNERETRDQDDVCVVYEDHLEMYNEFTKDTTAKLFEREGTVNFVEAPVQTSEQGEEGKLSSQSLRIECMEKLDEFIQLPYCYNLKEEFLMTKGKLDKNTVPVSLGQKMSELAT